MGIKSIVFLLVLFLVFAMAVIIYIVAKVNIFLEPVSFAYGHISPYMPGNPLYAAMIGIFFLVIAISVVLLRTGAKSKYA
jgi:hypothetical protein